MIPTIATIFPEVGSKTRKMRSTRKEERRSSEKFSQQYRNCSACAASIPLLRAESFGISFLTIQVTFFCANRRMNAFWWSSTMQRNPELYPYQPPIRPASALNPVLCSTARRKWNPRQMSFASLLPHNQFLFFRCNESALPWQSIRNLNRPILQCIGHGQRHRMRFVVEAPRMTFHSADFDRLRRRSCSEHFHFRAGPPRRISVLLHFAGYRYFSCACLTRIVHAQHFAFFVGECVPIIFIQCAVAIWTGIHAKLQRSARNLFRELYQLLHRHNRSGANVKRHLIQRRLQNTLILTAVLFRRPVVVPITRRQANHLRVHHLCRHRRHKQVSPEKKIVIVSCNSIRFRIFQKERPHQRNARPAHLFDACINVW